MQLASESIQRTTLATYSYHLIQFTTVNEGKEKDVLSLEEATFKGQ